MANGPSGRPPADGYPETRGSRLGAEQERERARKRLSVGKSNKQRSIEKRNRKARLRQDALRRKREKASSTMGQMEQQSLPETKEPKRQKRKVEMIPQGKLHAPLKECFHHFGGTELATYWHEQGFWSRAKSNPIGAARKLIAARAADQKQTSNRPVHDCLRRLVQHFSPKLEESRVAGTQHAGGVGQIVVDGDLLDERLKKIEAAQAAQADTNERIDRIAELVEKFVSSQTLPEKKAEVRVLHARKRINRIVKATGVAAGDYDLRFERLYAEAQFRWGIRWTKIAADCGIDAEGSGWKLDVAEATGRIEELLAIAIELYGEEAKQSRS